MADETKPAATLVTFLGPKEREKLHRAAARDHGFKIDPSKP